MSNYNGKKTLVSGTVKWFSEEKGYGFIAVPNRADVFVHWTGIAAADTSGRRNLEKGDQVEFFLELSKVTQRETATDVIRIG
jgi:CspA family cold shock protein